MYCRKCGSQLVSAAVFCSNCGTKQDQVPNIETVPPAGRDNLVTDSANFEITAYSQTTRFGFQKITTTIQITGEMVTVTANFHGKILLKTKPQIRQFKISDVVSISYGYGTITYFIDILRYLLAIVFIPFGGYSLLVLAFFIYVTICNAIKIKLKDGSKVVIYFDNQHLTTDFVEYINGRIKA